MILKGGENSKVQSDLYFLLATSTVIFFFFNELT